LKSEFIALGVHRIIGQKLEAVRETLKELQAVAMASSQPWQSSVAPLCDALLIMVSSGEVRTELATWSAVEEALAAQPIPLGDLGPVAPVPNVEFTSPDAYTASSQLPPPGPPKLAADEAAFPISSQAAVRHAANHRDDRSPSPTRIVAVKLTPDACLFGDADNQENTSPNCRRSASPGAGNQPCPAQDAIEPKVPVAKAGDLFLRLNTLAGKVVQLARAMEKLELRDRDIAARAKERLERAAAARRTTP